MRRCLNCHQFEVGAYPCNALGGHRWEDEVEPLHPTEFETRDELVDYLHELVYHGSAKGVSDVRLIKMGAELWAMMQEPAV